jgi:lipoyl(octanoyl) transferase
LQNKSFAVDKQELIFEDLGIIPYKEAWDYQEKLLNENVALKSAARVNGQNFLPQEVATQHHLLFCEHAWFIH